MRNFQRTWIAMAAFACLVLGMAVSAQESQSYSRAQIEQFVAPVALYPDAMLAQLFMASTYPVEVVEASGWARQNPNLRGDSLAVALDGQNWDVSVKSMVPFPNVLYRMADNQAWTQDLGDAFLVQPDDVMNAVQTLRRRAYDAGNLRTSEYQRVVVETQVIQVVPVSTTIIYVPAYNPMVVYGAGWGYPTYYYPTMMAPPPYYQPGNVISFGVGFAVGGALFGAFDWNQHNVYYGPNFYQYPGYRTNVATWQERYPSQRPGGHNNWQHDPVHRGSGGYNNPVLQKRYGNALPRPGSHPQKPRTTNAQPGTHPQEPRAAKPQPTTHPQEPTAAKPQPATHPQEQKATKPQPATHPREPRATNPQQGGHQQQPKTTIQRSGGNRQQPAKPPNGANKKGEEKK